MSFVRYECLKDIFCTLWVMDVQKMSFVCYECDKDVCLKEVFCTLRLYCTSSVRFECAVVRLNCLAFFALNVFSVVNEF